MSQTRMLPYVVWTVIGFIWGTTWAAIRIGLRDLPPLTFAAMRTTIAAVVLLLVAQLVASSQRPGRAGFFFWALVGVPQLGITYALVFWAEQSISSSLTAMLFATFPAFTAVLAHFMLRGEPITPRKIAGTLLAIVASVVLVGAPTEFTASSPWPMAAVLGASLSAAFAAVVVRGHGRTTSTWWLTAIQVASAAVFLVAIAFVFEQGEEIRITPRAVGAVLYLALVVTSGCYLSLFWLLKRLDATFVSMGVVFETAVAVFVGAMVLDEPVGMRLLAGLALVLVSIGLVNIRRRETAQLPI